MKELTIQDIGRFGVIPVVLAGVLLFFDVKDSWFALGWALGVSLAVVVVRKRRLSLTAVDLFVMGWLVYDLFRLVLLSFNPVSGLYRVDGTVVVVLYYFLLRSYLDNERKTALLTGLYALVIGGLLFIALHAFRLFLHGMEEAGWGHSVLDFKYLYRPMGYLNNVWNSFLIGFEGILALALYYFRHRKIVRLCLFVCLAGGALNLLLTFSRGAYLAFAFWAVAMLVLLFSSKVSLGIRKKLGMVVAFVALPVIGLLGLLPHQWQNVCNTWQFAETTSQQRSTEGRINSMEAAVAVFRDHMVWGVGEGNYSLAVAPYLFENDDASFTSFAPSSLVQLGVEKGLAGVLIWGGILVSFVVLFVRERKKDFCSYTIFVSLLAICIRELSFAAFFEYTGTMVVFFTLLAIYQNRYDGLPAIDRDFSKRGKAAALVIPIVLLCIVVSSARQQQQRDASLNSQCLNNIQAHRLDSAAYYMSHASDRLPDLLNKGMVEWLQYKAEGDTASLRAAETYLCRALDAGGNDNMVRYNLAMVWKHQGKRKEALQMMQSLSDRFPENALYHLGMYGLTEEPAEKERQLLDAVRTMPQLIETPLWKKAAADNALLTDRLWKMLDEEEAQYRYHPIRLAKYGKIYFLTGQTEKAERCLLRSVELLPSLVAPWRYLSQIAYERGDVDKGYEYFRHVSYARSTDEEEEAVQSYRFLADKYVTQFQRWYLTNTLPEVVFTDFELTNLRTHKLKNS